MVIMVNPISSLSSLSDTVYLGLDSVNAIYKSADNILTPADKFKTVGQFFCKSVDVANYNIGHSYFAQAYSSFKVFKTGFELTEFFNDFLVLLDPFENNKIDQNAVAKSLSNILKNRISEPKESKKAIDIPAFSKEIIEVVLKENRSIKNKNQFMKLIEQELHKKIINKANPHHEEIKNVKYKEVTEQLKNSIGRPLRQRTSRLIAISTCFAVSKIQPTLETLNKWNCINLKQIVNTMGQTKVFSFMKTTTLTMSPISAAFVSAGLTMVIKTKLEALKQTMEKLNQLNKNKNDVNVNAVEEIEQLKLKKNKLIWDIFKLSVDFAGVVLPATGLLLNPPALLALGFITKGMGVLDVYMKLEKKA